MSQPAFFIAGVMYFVRMSLSDIDFLDDIFTFSFKKNIHVFLSKIHGYCRAG